MLQAARPAPFTGKATRVVAGGTKVFAQEVAYRSAENMDDLRASAAVRAAVFYQYDGDRSEYAQKSHQKLKLDQVRLGFERVNRSEVETGCLALTLTWWDRAGHTSYQLN